MKHSKIGLVVFLGLALSVAGCAKKSTDQASLSGTGFDSVDKTEELAQLPQANTSNQQQAVEVLPIETSPITQTTVTTPGASIPTTTTPATTTGTTGTPSAQTLSRNQEIQTALKAAGFYSGNIDGKLGPASHKAIQAFQQSNGLKVDGKVGPKTWSALEKHLNGQQPSSTTESSGN